MDASCADEVIAVCLDFTQEVRLVLEVVEVDLACVQLLVCCRVCCRCYELDVDALRFELRSYVLDDLGVRYEVYNTLENDNVFFRCGL